MTANKKAKIHIIVAISEKTRVIGNKGSIPWYISDDLKHFKKLTTGHPIIMGRKTFESLGKALPNRTNIVITSKDLKDENIIVAHSIEEALERAQEKDENDIFIIGGGEIYKIAMPYADILNITLVHKDIEGDTVFPDYSDWKKVISKEVHLENDPAYTYLDLEK